MGLLDFITNLEHTEVKPTEEGAVFRYALLLILLGVIGFIIFYVIVLGLSKLPGLSSL